MQGHNGTKAGPGDVQCEEANVYSLLLVLALHAVQLVLCRSQWSRRLCMAALVGAIVNVIAVREIVVLTFMHQVMGMMAAEAAVRFLRCPLVVPTTLSDALVFSLLFVLNLGIVAGETVMAVRVDSGFALGIGPVFFNSTHFHRVAFYQKQHATLHAALCVLVLSGGTALVPRWRRSPTVQQARIVLEPACLVSVAMILFTHQHGADTPELASHPAIGTLMCLGAFVQVLCCLAHLSVPTRDGAPPDLTEPLAPADDAPALRMGRHLLAYAYLVLAYFLYVDTYMEYLGCRLVMLKVGEPNKGMRMGLTSGSELGTYLALGVMGAALALSCFIVHGTSRAPSEPAHAERPGDGCQQHLLLPLDGKDAALEPDAEEFAPQECVRRAG